MPEIGIMVRIKIKSAPERVDDFKRQKDFVDLVAMVKYVPSLWSTVSGVSTLRKDLRNGHLSVLKKELPRFSLDGTIEAVAQTLELDSNAVLEILGGL